MNYYEILEVSVNASKEVIKNAYRALIKKYHPDSYVGDKMYAQEMVKKINEAYETLIDDNKRLLYDYDNGFKIDPNAIVEQEETVVEENVKYKDNEEVQGVKNNKKNILKNKKVIIIGIIVLFVIAFVIGLLIAGSGDEKEEEKEDNQTEQVTENEDKDYTQTYIPNNSQKNTNTNTNTTTQPKTNEEKNVDNNKENTQTENKEDKTDIESNKNQEEINGES